MFGGEFPCSMPLCSQPMMCPYDVPVPQPFPCPYPVAQPYVQNIMQPVDMPYQNTIQPVMVPMPCPVPVPHPVHVPVDRPCAVPVPHPVPVPVDRPCPVPVPVPVCVPVPQPCAVPQPYLVREQVCVPYPVAVPVQVPTPYQYNVQEEYYAPPSCRQEEYVYEEPICVKRHHHRRRHHHHRSCTPMQEPLPPIIIPIPIQGQPEQPQLQITEYIQDIYPPAQVYMEQVPIGYTTNNTVVQQPGQIQNQQSLNCQPGVILPPASYTQPQQQLLQCLPNGQFVQRPLSIGGHTGVQTIMAQPSAVSQSNFPGLMNSSSSGMQLIRQR